MKTMRVFALVLSLICVMAFASPLVAVAAGGGLDDLSGLSSEPNSGQTGGQTGQSGVNAQPQHDDGGAIGDYLHGYTPVTGENMQKAGEVASPIVSFIGTVSGFIVMVVSAAIFMVTALDLAYIGLPFMRGILNPQYAAAGAAGGAPMGGMGGMGMGMRGGMGMMGGMGGGMAAGGAQPGMEHGLRRKWVSDEAVYCVQTYANPAGAQPAMGGAMGGMGGMGMGMGGMGAMGGMGGGAQQPMPMKSVILEYLKKRSFFLIVFAIATVILMSSVLTDCGLNLAALLTKVINGVSGRVSEVDINF